MALYPIELQIFELLIFQRALIFHFQCFTHMSFLEQQQHPSIEVLGCRLKRDSVQGSSIGTNLYG